MSRLTREEIQEIVNDNGKFVALPPHVIDMLLMRINEHVEEVIGEYDVFVLTGDKTGIGQAIYDYDMKQRNKLRQQQRQRGIIRGIIK